MAEQTQFNALSYFEEIANKNKLAQEQEFFVGYCSGIDGIGEAIEQYRKKKNFILIDDITSQRTYSNGVGFFDKQVYTVFILMSIRFGDLNDRAEKMEICRRLFRQFHSRLIHDKYENRQEDIRLTFLDDTSVYSREFPFTFDAEHCGLYFMVNNDEPVDLQYDSNDWEA